MHVATLQWRHNERDGVSNHKPHDCLLNRLFKAKIKENIKAPRHWPLWGEFTGNRWIPRTKGQYREKCFHLMTSSWSLYECHHDKQLAGQQYWKQGAGALQWRYMRVTASRISGHSTAPPTTFSNWQLRRHQRTTWLHIISGLYRATCL